MCVPHVGGHRTGCISALMAIRSKRSSGQAARNPVQRTTFVSSKGDQIPCSTPVDEIARGSFLFTDGNHCPFFRRRSNKAILVGRPMNHCHGTRSCLLSFLPEYDTIRCDTIKFHHFSCVLLLVRPRPWFWIRLLTISNVELWVSDIMLIGSVANDPRWERRQIG